jgi:hypothetical protein
MGAQVQSTLRDVISVRARSRRFQGAALLLLTVGGILAGLRFFGAEAVPVLDPIYQIETVSNGHRGSLLNLRMGQPGVPQVPTPMDVDGDLLSDILVAVNLIDVSGAVSNPPNPGPILAPNVEITRDPSAVARCLPLTPLNKCSPPLRVEVKLRLLDSADLKEDQVLRFGYDTGNNGSLPACAPEQAPCPDDLGRIGSIPPYFKATLRGLEDFFNPLTADISTRGFGLLGQTTNNVELNRVINGYEGPLDIVGSMGTAGGITSRNGSLLESLNVLNGDDDKADDLRLGYRPWPGEVTIGYSSDDAGSHITYRHERKDEVDLNARLVQFDRKAKAAEASVFEARIDRLPRRATLDFQTADKSGNVRFTANADGRLPDVHVAAVAEKLDILTKKEVEEDEALKLKLDARLAGLKIKEMMHLFLGGGEEDDNVVLVPKEPPLIVEGDIEGLPPVLEGNWNLPTGGPVSALFCAGEISDDEPAACDPAAQGIGAAEANVRNFYGDATKLPSFVPEQQQFLSFENVVGGQLGPETRITARVDRIREVAFAETAEGFSATARAGDGELPLLLHVTNDDRTATEGLTLDASATVAPLPDSLTATLVKPGANQKTDPLKLVYDTSKSVDVTSKVDLKLPGAGNACGEKGTVCGTLDVRHIPAHIETRVGTFQSETPDIGGTKLFPESRIEIDAVPREGGTQPDFFADVIVGIDDGGTPTNFADDMPLVAHAELLSFPESTRIRAKQGATGSIDRIEFHACDWDYDATTPACSEETEGDRIGSVSASLRNWFTRPADLPILVPATPIYATVAARGVDQGEHINFEANAKITDISELQVRNTGKTFGLRTRVGGGKDLSATVDAGNILVPDTDLVEGRVDLVGQTIVSPLPDTWNFCFRQADQRLETLSDSFTDECEATNPFGDPRPLAVSPLSIAYTASSPFSVSAELAMHQRGNDPTVVDDHRYRATLDVQNLPKDMTAHVQAPAKDKEGPIRAIYRGPSNGTPLTVDVRAESLDADLVCADPRTPLLGKKALCAEGRIENLPTRALVVYDPTKRTENLIVDTDSQINLTGIPQLDPSLPEKKFTVSMVEGKRKSDDNTKPDFNVVIPDIVIAEAKVTGLPKKVIGTIDLPGAIEINADPPLGAVDATVRNFVVPDPMPKKEPLRQVGPGLTADPDNPNIQKVVFFGRHDTDTDRLLFKGTAHISDVRGFSYNTARDVNRNLLDTKVITVDFARNQTVRAYADVDLGTEHIIGDVLLPNVPAGMTVCFRGEKSSDPTFGQPVVRTFCDDAPANDKQGAFQLVQRPNPPVGLLDVHAYLRHSKGGDADVLSARVDVKNIPRVVQGTFGDGTADVGGFSQLGPNNFGTNPTGIDRIGFHLATFDIGDHGYPSAPFTARTVTKSPFPAVTTARQHVGLAMAGDDFEVVGRIGEVGAAVPASDLVRVKIQDTHCLRPNGFGTRPDFPFYPDDPVWTYTCVRGDFAPTGPAGADPLDIDVRVDKDGERITLREAGLTDLPDFFQFNMAKGPSQVPGTDPNRPLRPACLPVGVSQPANCAPPFVRLDTPGDSALFGVAEVGKISDVIELNKVTPRTSASADFDAAPGFDGCGWTPQWGACQAGNALGGPFGLRAKLGLFEPPGGGDPRKAIKAGIRLQIPASLTIDQIMSWSGSGVSPAFFEASDLKIHAAFRNDNGTIVKKTGEAAAFINNFGSNDQILLADANNGPIRGFALPGEIGFEMYVRDAKGKGRKFIQIDGRVSTKMNVGARILSGGETPQLDARILNIPATQAGDAATKPSFRLRAEIDGDKETPTPTPPTDPPPDPPKEEDCSILFCVETQVKLKAVDALFDFEPDSGEPARLIEAVVRKDGIKNGAEIIGWANVDGSGGQREFKAAVDVLVQPLNIFLHAGIPIIGSFDFVLLSDLRAGLSVETSHFTLRQNLLHINASAPGGLGGSGLFSPCTGFNCLYTSYRIYVMHGLAFSIVGVLWGNPILLGIDFLPPSLPRIPGLPAAVDWLDPTNAQLEFLECGNGGLTGEVNRLTLNVPRNVVAWPLHDPRIITYGTLKPVFDFVADFAAPVFCFFGTGADDIPLISGSDGPGGANRVPGDPVGIAGHAVPGTATNPADSVVATPAAPPALVVPNGQTVALCGDHIFETVSVSGTLNVATAADSTPVFAGGPARCVGGAANVNRLSITAGGSHSQTTAASIVISSGATVNGGSARLTLIGDTISVSGAVRGGKGKVTLAAGKTLTVSGAVTANGVNDVRLPEPIFGFDFRPTGNGGGGHGGGGGKGSAGGGGFTFGNSGFTPSSSDGLVPTEAGSAAGPLGAVPGKGGGALTLIAGDTMTLSGTVTANGDPGGNASDTTCANGSAGGGGGAGGGIMLAAPQISATGTLAAVGGKGGNGKGAGGGGGGGRIKIKSPLFSGGANTGHGLKGTEGCADEPDALDGNDGASPREVLPVSTALPLSQFWNNEPLGIPYSAAARVIPDGDDPPSNDFQVVLCGVFVQPDRPELDLLKEDGSNGQDQKADNLQLAMQHLIPDPDSVSTLTPCGAFDFLDGRPNPATLKVEKIFNATRASGTITPNWPQKNGYWGVWTSVLKPHHDGDDCTDPVTAFLSCEVEPMPTKPEVVFGFDNIDPSFVLSTDVTTTNPDGVTVTGSPNINLTISNAFDHMTRAFPQPDQDPTIPLSGVKDYICLAVDIVRCTDGTTQQKVLVQNQQVTVQVFQFDQAGNDFQQEFELIVDTVPPTSDGRILTPLPAGVSQLNNGWYSASPHFRLDTFADPDTSNSKGAGFGKYVYRFDDGDERECTSNPCIINTNLPGPGRHTLHWRAVDKVGNEEVNEHSLVVKIDGDDPLVEFSTAPGSPDGANKWFTGPTFGAISTFDLPPGGSGLKPKAGDPAPDPTKPFGVFYGIDDTTPTTPYTGAFQMPAGSHVVCFQAIDLAGNTDGVHCSQPVNVDLAVPNVAINANPGTPDGTNGWYVSTPAVTVNASDPAAGSTVNPAFDPDLSDLCLGRRAVPNAPSFTTPSGTCVSVDGGAYAPHFGATITIPEGAHVVRAFSVDVSGQRSPVREATYQVDLSHPVTAARVIPPAPARAEWWRRLPRVVLRASDGEANAGLERIEYSIDGGAPVTYTGPFEIASGVHTVTYQSFDRAGPVRTEEKRSVVLSVDVGPSVVKATEPDRAVWLLGGLLQPKEVQLHWTVKDDLSDKLRAVVIVYNALGQPVRRIVETVDRTVTPGGAPQTFSTAWDGKDQSLLGLVPAGVYHYRVIVIDEAGNVSQSGESKPIQIKVGLL